MWKHPRRRFKAGNAQDVDDFNEAFYEAGSEGGRITEHNTNNQPFGVGSAGRVLWWERNIGLQPAVESDYDASPNGPALLDITGWVTAVSKTVISRAATLRISGRYGVDDVTPDNQGAIRVDGVLIYDSKTDLTPGHAARNIFALVDVPAGSHTIDLVVQSDGDGASYVENRMLDILVMEK